MKHSDIAHYRNLIHLRRNYTARARRFPPVLEPAALVDIVLLVLLFFIFSSPHVTRPGVRVNLPETNYVEALPLNSMVLTISQEEMLFFNDERTTLDNLPEAFARMAFEFPDRTLVIEADERVPYKTLVQVYQDARAEGIEDVALATRFVRPEVETP